MRPDLFDDVDLMAEISIHAPAKGATWSYINFLMAVNISIHAPAKGATCNRQKSDKLMKISIHAPAKGATPFSYTLY